jgi:diamine N-acetyltransferase
MKLLRGKHIYLRASEPADLELLYAWENNTDYWPDADNTHPYSRKNIQDFLNLNHQDIYTLGQMRMMICTHQNEAIGCIDLFDFNARHQRAALGILIADESNRGKGYASEALELLIQYSFDVLFLKQIYCSVLANNETSIDFFKKAGFEECGRRKQWYKTGKGYTDEVLFQRLNIN